MLLSAARENRTRARRSRSRSEFYRNFKLFNFAWSDHIRCNWLKSRDLWNEVDTAIIAIWNQNCWTTKLCESFVTTYVVQNTNCLGLCRREICGESRSSLFPDSLQGRVLTFHISREVRQLIREGANPNVLLKRKGGLSPFHLAVGLSTPKSIEIAAVLLDSNADPNNRSSDGLTPLHIAGNP